MTDKWLPILVRLEDYPDVTAFIAEREAQRKGTAVGAPEVKTDLDEPEDARLAGHTPWPLNELRRLEGGGSLTAKRWVRAMDVCSQVAGSGEWLSTSEVATRAGMTISEWRDAPRKITRHLKAHYPSVPTDERGDHIWPLRAANMPGSPEVHWAMNVEQARRWREVRDGAGS